ncbi:MAG: Ni/Fe hydrogenase subunit alpha [Coriobacteriales bacterium]|nr:Ni/Fe hydrogenase subunit alpha [Coriobacteriales bacterium]
MSTLTVEHVARIEGHGTITVDVDGGEVRDIRMDVIEPVRLFESMVVGRRFDEAPLITSRICGICSPNHAVTSLKAVEAALGIEVSERTQLLRKLLLYASYLQNHATHLYVFAAPDYVGGGIGSVFPLATSAPDVVQRALRIKKLGNELTTALAGRSVHPITPVVGGFSSEPAVSVLEAFVPRLAEAARDAGKTAALVATFVIPTFEPAGEMLAMVDSDDYAIYEGSVCALDAGWCRDVSEYRSFITETVVGHSNAKHSTVDGRPFMVGALPRVNQSWDRLAPTARVVASKLGFRPVSRNTFHNNLCQAIELIDAAERCASYIEQFAAVGGSSTPEAFAIKSGSGSGATEAPRGTLYHSLSIDDDGIVTAGDVITPTAQNLANLEADMRAFAPTVAALPEPEFVLRIEQLVRAYDPCLSCSVH